jgi:hypothetical protein
MIVVRAVFAAILFALLVGLALGAAVSVHRDARPLDRADVVGVGMVLFFGFLLLVAMVISG